MYYTDYHAHSSCSPDGMVPMAEMAAAAVQAGLSEFCLTDHCDLLGLRGERFDSYDWAPVLAQRREMLAALGTRLALPLGLEFGMSHVDLDASRRILDQPELDFVIGSVHNYSPQRGGLDFYTVRYSTPELCYDALDDYFSSMALLAREDTYDVLGHIIYPLRYMNVRDGQSISLEGYTDQLTSIFRCAVQQGRGIEVNTWTGKTVEDWRPILELYRACGGEIVTVGSDAHIPQGVGKGISQAYELLANCGFRYVAAYRRRKPSFFRLSS